MMAKIVRYLDYLLLGLLGLLRVGEYVIAHYTGDRDGQITRPLLVNGLPILYIAIFLLLIFRTKPYQGKLCQIVLFIGIVVTSATLCFFLFTVGHNWGDDFIGYLTQTRSLLEGRIQEFFIQNTFIFEHSAPGIGPIAYPWGFPMLLAPVYALWGFDLLAFKMVNLVCFLLFLLCAFWLLRPRLDFLETLCIVAFLAFHPDLLAFQDSIWSDTPFLLFSTFSLLLIDRWLVQTTALPNVGQLLAMGLSIFFTYEIRTNGLLLFIAMFICQGKQFYQHLQQRSFGWTPFIARSALPYGVFPILVIGCTLILPGAEGSYLSFLNFTRIFELIQQNAYYYFIEVIPEFFAPFIFIKVFYSVFMVFAFIGIISRFRQDVHLWIYSGATIGLYMIFPGHQGLRYIFPVLLFLIYAAFQGFKAFWQGICKRCYHPYGAILVGLCWIWLNSTLLLMTFDRVQANLSNLQEPEGPFDTLSTEIFNVVKKRTAPESVIGFFKPRLLTFLTGRNSFTLIRCQQFEIADYFIVNKYIDDYNQVDPVRLSECEKWGTLLPLYENPRFILYRIIHPIVQTNLYNVSR